MCFLYSCDILVKNIFFVTAGDKGLVCLFCVLLSLSRFTIYFVGFMIVTDGIHLKFSNKM